VRVWYGFTAAFRYKLRTKALFNPLKAVKNSQKQSNAVKTNQNQSKPFTRLYFIDFGKVVGCGFSKEKWSVFSRSFQS